MRGICKLSVIPVRTEPSDKSEMCTQLLFGEMYSVEESLPDGKWLRVSTYTEGYPGWISANQHFPVTDSYYSAYQAEKHPLSCSIIGWAQQENSRLLIMPGSTLPFLRNNELRLSDETYTFSGDYTGTGKPVNWLEAACMYLKAPYLWGGRTLAGIDCSGFTQTVLRVCGYRLPRDAYQQAEQGVLIRSVPEAQPGDLAFFSNSTGRITHVGIILANNKIIHASGEVRIDELHPQGIWHGERKIYTHTLASIKRVMDKNP